MRPEPKLCPCDSGKAYADCCKPYHDAERVAKTAEALMRSRYAAYVLLNEAYLLASWQTSTRPPSLNLKDEPRTKWLGLKVMRTQKGQAGDSEGSVEFVARYKINGKAYKLHEVSRFVKESGKWYYINRIE